MNTITAVLLAQRVNARREKPYRIRVVGPSGYERWLGTHEFDLVQDVDEAKMFADRELAEGSLYEVEPVLSRRGFICDIVNINDPEERC